jgi:hypothetical protein
MFLDNSLPANGPVLFLVAAEPNDASRYKAELFLAYEAPFVSTESRATILALFGTKPCWSRW